MTQSNEARLKITSVSGPAGGRNLRVFLGGGGGFGRKILAI